jgi:1-acyl-sn-glycerol-3-phosphate acyltransferase
MDKEIISDAVDVTAVTPQKIKFKYRTKYRNMRIRLISKFLRVFVMRKHRTINIDVIDTSEPYILISNHRMIYGPAVHSLVTPLNLSFTINHFMLSSKELGAGMYTALTSESGWPKSFAKIAAGIPAAGISWYLRSLDPVPIYHDNRALTTMKGIIAKLEEGRGVAIMPEDPKLEGRTLYDHNFARIVEGPAAAAHLYYKKTGKTVNIVCGYGFKEQGIIRFATVEPLDATATDITAERTALTERIYQTMKQLERDNQRDIESGLIKTRCKYIRAEKKAKKRAERQAKKESKKSNN